MPGLPSDVTMTTSRSRDQQSMAQSFSSSGIGSQTSRSGFLSNVSQQRYVYAVFTWLNAAPLIVAMHPRIVAAGY